VNERTRSLHTKSAISPMQRSASPAPDGWRAIGDLKQFPGNPRQHPECQIARLMKSIQRVWTNPILIDEPGTILAGHGRFEAAKRAAVSVACIRSAFLIFLDCGSHESLGEVVESQNAGQR
jgi:hypothetical protein